MECVTVYLHVNIRFIAGSADAVNKTDEKAVAYRCCSRIETGVQPFELMFSNISSTTPVFSALVG